MKRKILFVLSVCFVSVMLPACASKKPSVLYQNYPNPFTSETWIPYDLAANANVTITIFSVEGQPVRKLELDDQSAGSYQSQDKAAYWDGRNDKGEMVSEGIYFYHLDANDFQETKKMLILKSSDNSN